jgi:dTMP kinase
VSSGRLFVFEGADEVGKTTIASRVAAALRSKGEDCRLCAFPGTRPGTLGWHIYEVHHEPKQFGIKHINPTSLQLMHVAAHIDTIDSEIMPALKKGQTVLLDRFWWSTWVYGVTYRANKTSLKTAIRAELTHWRSRIPTRLFLITRRAPLERQRDMSTWEKISHFYSRFATNQRRFHPVTRVANDGTIEATVTDVLERICGGQIAANRRAA